MKPKYDISFFPPAVAHMLSEVYLCDKLLRIYPDFKES